jgi:hypothetical protein
MTLSKEGLTSLVEYNEKKMFEVKLKEIKSTLTSMINDEVEISEVIETVKQQVKDAKFPDIEVIRMLWDVLMEAVQWSGKNQQQNSNSALRQVSINLFIEELSLETVFKPLIVCKKIILNPMYNLSPRWLNCHFSHHFGCKLCRLRSGTQGMHESFGISVD